MSERDIVREYVEELHREIELVKLLTVGRMDESGDFCPGAGLKLKDAVFLADISSHGYRYPNGIATVQTFYDLFKDIEAKESNLT